MTKEEIASVIEQIATLLELKGENPLKIRAYTNAARAIETFGANVTNFQDEEAVAKIPGIGKSIALKTKELAETRTALLDGREVDKNYLRARIVWLQFQRAMESSAGRRPIPHEGMI
jgi:DNA polymerase/3'-5' exonuclease PolX